MIEKIINHVQESENIHSDIMNLIGPRFGGTPLVERNISPIEDYRKFPWGISKTELRIFTDGNCDDYWCYTISSYSAKGEMLYMKEIEDHFIVMAHPDDESYSNTTIFIFSKNNRVILDSSDGRKNYYSSLSRPDHSINSTSPSY